MTPLASAPRNPARRSRRARTLPPWRRRLLPAAVYVASFVAVAVGVALAVPGIRSAASGARYPVSADAVAVARAELAELPVKGRAPRTGYDRDVFGQAWFDVDGNGCDTRNDVLGRDLGSTVTKPGTAGCLVLSGRLLDPYSGQEIDFARGPTTSARVQIDHVVPLSDAWQKGARTWTGDVRRAFANDPANLLAVDGELNQDKGGADAATWLPPHTPFRCRYVIAQIGVKRAYGLWVTAAERDAMDRQLAGCEVRSSAPGAEPVPP